MTDPALVLVMEGADLDRRVAKYVRGWEWRRPTHGNCCTCQRCGRDHDECCGESCRYSESLEAAVPVLDAMRASGWEYEMCSRSRLVTFRRDKASVDADADDLATAVCRAAVRAVLTVTCPRCEGAGLVDAPDGDKARKWPCDDCDMTGQKGGA
jgi:hypothetical protein